MMAGLAVISAGARGLAPYVASRYAAASTPTTANFIAGAGQEAVERAAGVSVPEATPIGLAGSTIYNYFADIFDSFKRVDPEYGAKLEKERLAKVEAMYNKK